MADFLSFISRGCDLIGSLNSLWNHGMGKVKNATVNGLIQPLGNAIGVGILQKQESSRC